MCCESQASASNRYVVLGNAAARASQLPRVRDMVCTHLLVNVSIP